MDYGVTEKGFILKRFDRILEEVQSAASKELGFDVTQDQQSLLNSAIIYPFCDAIAELWEMGKKSYDQKYPSTAEGISLDNACEFGNIRRKGSVPTQYLIHVTAKEGVSGDPTIIPRNSIVSSVTNPVVHLRCLLNTTITRELCNGIAVKPVVTTAGRYTVELNGNFYSYTAETTTTVKEIIDGLKEAFTLEDYTVENQDDKLLVIMDNDRARLNNIILSSNMTSEYVVSLVPYYTEQYGEVELPLESITVITSNVTGMIACRNLLEPTPGRIEQTDTELRKDYFRKSYSNSTRQTEALESVLLDEVDNVRSVRCYENSDDYPDEYGRPPHSIEVIVDGGEGQDIAEKIQEIKSGGIQTVGRERYIVIGEYGDPITIKFNRPDIVYTWIKIELTRGSNAAIDPDYEEIITEYILEFVNDLTIGDHLITQKMINGIYEALPGIIYCRTLVAVGSDYVTKPEESEFYEGNVLVTERGMVEIVNSRIEVVLQ